MEQKDRPAEQYDATQYAQHGESTSPCVYGEQEHQGKTEISQSGENDPSQDGKELVKEFLAWVKKEKIPAHGWITALSSIALLCVTGGQLVVGCENYRETSPLVDYARRNTEASEKFSAASERNAAAAEGFSTSASNINNGIGNAVGKLNAQATQATNLVKATDTLATWSEQSAKVELALNRPSITVQNPTLEKIPNGTSTSVSGYLMLSMQNSGRLAAQSVRYKYRSGRYSYSLLTVPGGLEQRIRNTIDSASEWNEVGDIPFGSPSNHVIPFVNLTVDPDGPIYYWAGKIEYADQLGNWQWVEFCIQVQTSFYGTRNPTATASKCPVGQNSGTYQKTRPEDNRAP